MQLHSARMRFLNRECEWIVTRTLSLYARQQLRPRLERRQVDGITGGTDLQYYSIEPGRFRLRKQIDKLRLLLSGCESSRGRPVDIGNRGNPHSAHLAGYGRGSRVGGRYGARIGDVGGGA